MELSNGVYCFRCAIKLLNLVLESNGLYLMRVPNRVFQSRDPYPKFRAIP